jgi:phosphate uptake regulator
MRRKVIKLGENSLLVSLPSKWVQQHGIRKGDEISVEEKEGKLVLQSTSMPAGNKAAIDITGLNPAIRRVLGALYKKGYDEFTVHFSSNDELETAYGVIREAFTGFEVVQHGKNHIVVREISQPNPEQFDAVLRRQFLVIKDYASEISTALQKRDYGWLKRLVLRDKDVNKLADFCRRLINKNMASNATGLYIIVEQLEKISDKYSDISMVASQKKLAPSKEFMRIYSQVTDYLNSFYECFYRFSLPGLSKFVARRRPLLEEISKSGRKAKPEEQRLFFWLEDIAEKTFELNGALMIMHL